MDKSTAAPETVISSLRCEDVVALTQEAARISGLIYIMDAHQEEAEAVLNG